MIHSPQLWSSRSAGVPHMRWSNTRGAYTTAAVAFDGTNDFLLRGADLTGIADGKAGLLSIWIKMQGGDAAQQRILVNGGGFFRFYRSTDNKFHVDGFNAAAAEILHLTSTSTYVSGGSWTHVAASWDLAAGAGKMYIGGADATAASPTLTNDTIDYANATTEFSVGATGAGAAKLNADVADIYFTTTYLDLTNAANLAKLISGGKPVDLGANGSLPTGSQPLLFLRGPASSFNTNLGSGGNFTVTGALTDAATSPSD